MSELVISVGRPATAFAASAWDACANPPGLPHDPFVSHAFIAALEESGSASAATGWLPCHVAAERAGVLVGLLPAYLKSHSMGEFVFDHAFARAYEAAGGEYYPKLQAAVPFTPVTGRRFLLAAGADADEIEPALLAGAAAAMRQHAASSVHITFLTEAEWRRHGEAAFLQRTDSQFCWRNAGYASFDGFLAELASRKRKALRREREQALEAGITVEWLTGTAIGAAEWDAMFAFYRHTGERKWGRPYLNRACFDQLRATMADRMLLVLARRGGKPVAGALNFIGGDCLYGRYWGAVEDHPALHFELCYYQAIDYAIAHGLPRVEAGAQGEHKLARGYLPMTTYSLHAFADRGLQRAVATYLQSERAAVAEQVEALAAAGPFRRDEK